MAIEVVHLNKSYGKQQVLKDITLHIEEGEVVGLLGPNGAGKSTLMKSLLGLIEYEGMINAPMRHGYLPENNPLYESMYVREYLLLMSGLGSYAARSSKGSGGSAHGCSRSQRDRVEELIERVGLMPEVHKKIGELSKGYRQRVGLAQALLNDPELLILDEPTTGLDPNQLEEIRALIRQAGHDRTVILSTHIMQEVKQMCNRVVIIDHGQIKADKKMDEIEDLETLFKEVTNG